MVVLAGKWSTKINFSCYTPLHIRDENRMRDAEKLKEVRASFQRLIGMKKAGYPVYSSEHEFGQAVLVTDVRLGENEPCSWVELCEALLLEAHIVGTVDAVDANDGVPLIQ